jgi:hypothetical protein
VAAVKVFIGNLPRQARLLDLKGFLGKINLQANFDCHRGKDALQGNYYYFVAHTDTEVEGLALIAQVNGRRFYDKRVIARRFNPRENPCDPTQLGLDDRRVNRGEVDDPVPLDEH